MPESKTTVNSSCRCGKRAVTIATGLVIKGLAVALLCPPMARDVVAQLIGTRLDAEERQMLIQELREALNSQSGWPRVHAAEALIAEGLSDETLPVFRPLVESAPPPERIGVWRVLAQAETSAEARRRMVERVRAAFRDVNGPDRLHAVETLAKLRVRVSGEDQAAVERFASGPAGEAAFANWLLAIGGNADARQALVDALRHPEPLARQRAAYSLSRLEGPRSPAERAALAEAARAEPIDSSARMTLIGAAARAGDDRERFRRLLVEAIGSPDAELRRQAAVWLAEVGVPEDRAALATLQADDDARVRMAAASARLRIEGRLLLR